MLKNTDPPLFLLCLLVISGIGLFVTSCATSSYAGRDDLRRIFETENFQLVYHVNEISLKDWVSVGEINQERRIVDPGEPYDSGDMAISFVRVHQLILAAKNPRHEVLCYWAGTHGGPMLCVRMLERRTGKPRIVFSAIMYNDISPNDWNWEQVRLHIRDNKMDVLPPYS